MSVHHLLNTIQCGATFVFNLPGKACSLVFNSVAYALKHLENGIKSLHNGPLNFVAAPITYLSSTIHKGTQLALWQLNCNQHLITNTANSQTENGSIWVSERPKKILDLLEKVPIETRRANIQLFHDMIGKNFSADERVDVLKFFLTVPENERADFAVLFRWAIRDLNKYNSLFEHNRPAGVKSPWEVICSISYLKDSQKAHLVKAVNNPSDPIHILKEMNEIHIFFSQWSLIKPSEFVDAQEIINSVVNDSEEENKHLHLIFVLSSLDLLMKMKKSNELDSEQISNFLEALALVEISKNAFFIDLREKALALEKFPPEKRLPFAKSFNTQMTTEFKFNQITHIALMNALSGINISSYDEYFFQKNQFMDKVIPAETRESKTFNKNASDILYSVHFDDYTSEDAEEFAKLVKKLTIIPNYDIRYLLKASSNLPNAHRKLVIEAFIKYVPKYLHAPNVEINSLCSFSLAQLTFLNSSETELLHKKVDYWNTWDFIYAIENLELISRLSSKELAFQIMDAFITKFPDTIKKSDFILWLTFIPSELHPKVLNTLKTFPLPNLESETVEPPRSIMAVKVISQILEKEPELRTAMNLKFAEGLHLFNEANQRKVAVDISFTFKEIADQQLVSEAEEIIKRPPLT